MTEITADDVKVMRGLINAHCHTELERQLARLLLESIEREQAGLRRQEEQQALNERAHATLQDSMKLLQKYKDECERLQSGMDRIRQAAFTALAAHPQGQS